MRTLKIYLKNLYRFFPVQLLMLHFRKYQILLIFWLVLFSTVAGNFLKSFGADALILAPEYLGESGTAATFLTGIALGVFFMSWNITTFILHSKRFKFLATTRNPFLKYCINNSLLPILFLIYYCYKMVAFNDYIELRSAGDIVALIVALFCGLLLVFLVSFAYFFTAERTIVRSIAPLVASPDTFRKTFDNPDKRTPVDVGLKVNYYLSGRLYLRKPRSVTHYRETFIEVIFKKHHLAGMFSIMLAFMFLVLIGFFLDNRFFEMPAAASFLILFAVLTAVIGALVYFLASWSLLVAIVFIAVLNFFYKHEIIDPRNKAYGLRYDLKSERPAYNKNALQALSNPADNLKDHQQMLGVLENWKKKQPEEKPLLVFINVSGGGLRSAAFVMATLQKMDSLSNGDLMSQTFMITGASGGMLAATYYRELYLRKLNGKKINLNDGKYGERITGDLLNPIFTSMVARDLLAPAQKFSVDEQRYVKDRGYAFEKKLSVNTRGVLDFQLKDRMEDEAKARIPLMIYNSVIKSDGRKMMICSQPIRFMMKPYQMKDDPAASPDAVDFNMYFKNLSPYNLRALTALRMNATFPYVLPNVWLPTNPVIDVMDAGLRDNYGSESTLRFIHYFQNWIDENTSGVVVLSIRDKQTDNWQNPVLTTRMSDMFINPFTMLQQNWYKIQDYYQNDQFEYLASSSKVPFYRIPMVYVPEKEGKMAAMNFHISARERKEVQESFYHPINAASVKKMVELLKKY